MVDAADVVIQVLLSKTLSMSALSATFHVQIQRFFSIWLRMLLHSASVAPGRKFWHIARDVQSIGIAAS